ncbi:MAG: chemotaxis protein CheA [Polyangiaceae bacterium]|nr:chemotaxis protein CheA [Polyangiaceae bacterium]
MTRSLSDIQKELLVTFFAECEECLDQLETGLLSLESSPEDMGRVVDDVFRAAHSIKGGAGGFSFTEIGGLAHAMESVLDDFRSGRSSPSQESLAVLLSSVDLLRVALGTRKAGDRVPADSVEQHCLLLEALRGSKLGHPAAPKSAPPVVAAPAESAGYRVRFKPMPRLLETGNEPVRLLHELVKLGDARVEVGTERLPSLQSQSTMECYLDWSVTLSGPSATRAALEDVFTWVDSDAELSIEALDASPTVPGPIAVPAPSTPSVSKAESRAESAPMGSIRVGVDKIDLLMNMVGELVITQSMLGELDHDTKLSLRRIEQLREGLGLLARNTRALQESVMRLRSVPISVVFNRFPRLVHDLGQQLGKQVELKVSGQTTEIDKTVVEKLGDPLIHLVRNSLDHGLESAEQRRAAGKPDVGTLELCAFHHGGDVVVEVRDDGRGLDREKLLQRGRERGLVASDETPSDDAIRELIFAPGFSTAKEVTDVSGRGVGMDVVRRNIEALGGSVLVDSSFGKGTRIVLRLPLTLAIIDGQLLRVGEHSYVVPLLSIVESVQVEPRAVTRYQGKRELYRFRDQLIPMVETGRLLGLPGWKRDPDSLMVIVETDGGHIGLLVDELLAQQQVVVKSLETNYERVEGLSGATILGDGGVAFILDTVAIGKMVRGASAVSGGAAA